MIRLTAQTDVNPLIARNARKMGIRLGLAAAAVVAGATLVVAASLSTPAPAAATAPTAAATQSQPAAAPADVQTVKPAKQVRVIPLWNTPRDQRGL